MSEVDIIKQILQISTTFAGGMPPKVTRYGACKTIRSWGILGSENAAVWFQIDRCHWPTIFDSREKDVMCRSAYWMTDGELTCQNAQKRRSGTSWVFLWGVVPDLLAHQLQRANEMPRLSHYPAAGLQSDFHCVRIEGDLYQNWKTPATCVCAWSLGPQI